MKISSEVANLQGRLIEVHNELQREREAAKKDQSLTFSQGVYWNTYPVEVSDEAYEAAHGVQRSEMRWDGPFCPLCKDVDEKAVRLKDDGGFQNSADRSWICELHKTYYRPHRCDHKIVLAAPQVVSPNAHAVK
jgi:hypothetical protein